MIVGRDVLLSVEKTDATPAGTVLDVVSLKIDGKHGAAVDDITFSVLSGEI
jgi:ABC-type uncharacterized transport system ATPase subunit